MRNDSGLQVTGRLIAAAAMMTLFAFINISSAAITFNGITNTGSNTLNNPSGFTGNYICVAGNINGPDYITSSSWTSDITDGVHPHTSVGRQQTNTCALTTNTAVSTFQALAILSVGGVNTIPSPISTLGGSGVNPTLSYTLNGLNHFIVIAIACGDSEQCYGTQMPGCHNPSIFNETGAPGTDQATIWVCPTQTAGTYSATLNTTLSTIQYSMAVYDFGINSGSGALPNLNSSSNSLMLSNTMLQIGQSITANTVISGGIGLPFNGEFTLVANTNALDTVINTITTGGSPISVAFNPQGTLAYVTSSSTDTVNVINPATNLVINTIQLGSPGANPSGVAFNPSGTLAYVTNQGFGVNSVSVINPVTNSVVSTITVGNGPDDVVFNPSGTLAYVPNFLGTTVSVISVATNTVVNTITSGGAPTLIAFNPSGTLLYVANQGSGTVNVINPVTNTVINTIISGGGPSGIAFNPSGTLAYVTEQAAGTVNVINVATNTIVNTIAVGSSPFGVAINPSGTLAYVTSDTGTTVSEINVVTNTLINTITVGNNPNIVTFNPSGTLTYVTNLGGSSVSVIAPPETAVQPLATVQTNNGLLQLTINALTSNSLSFSFNGVTYNAVLSNSQIYGSYTLYAYAKDSNGNNVTVSNTFSISPVPFTASPNALKLSSNVLTVGSTITANFIVSGGALTGFSGEFSWAFANQLGSTVVNTITGLTQSYGVAFNPQGTLAYISDENNAVKVINVAENKTVNTIAKANEPLGVVFSPSGTLAYIDNFGNNTVGVVNVATNTVVNTISGGFNSPESITLNPQGTLLYVPNTGTTTVSVINTATDTVVNTLTGLNRPVSVAFNPSGTIAYITNGGGGSGTTVSVINVATNTVVNTLTGFNEPYGLSFSPSGTIAYIANYGSNVGTTVNVINVATNTVVNTITGFLGPASVEFNPSGTYAYVVNYGTPGTVNVINVAQNKTVNTITGVTQTVNLAINPQGTLLYLPNVGPGTVNVIGNLPETSVQSLPTVQTSNGLAQVSIFAQSSNTLVFTLNGIQYTQSTGSKTIYGTLNLFGFAEDNGTNQYGFGANTLLLANTITISSLVSKSLNISSTLAYPGENENLSANALGGTGPYTYNFLVYNSMGLVTSALRTGPTTNSFAFTINSLSGTGIFTVNVITKDSAAPNAQVTNTLTFMVYSALQTPVLTPSSGSITNGQSVTFTASWAGGIPTYTASLYSSATSPCTTQSTFIQTVTGITGNSTTFSAVSPSSSTYYCAYVTANVLNPYISGVITQGFNSLPWGIAFNPAGTFAYVTNYDTNNVVIINTATNTVTNALTSGLNEPQELAISPGGNIIYVANRGSANVVAINTITHSVIASTGAVFSEPIGLALAPSGAYLYVTDFLGGDLAVVNTLTMTVSNTFSTGFNFPFTAAFAPSGSYAYIGNHGTANVVIVNTATNLVTGAITGTFSAHGITFSPTSGYAYINNGSAPIAIINTTNSTVVGTFKGITNGQGVAISPGGTYAYATNLNGNVVDILNTNIFSLGTSTEETVTAGSSGGSNGGGGAVSGGGGGGGGGSGSAAPITYSWNTTGSSATVHNISVDSSESVGINGTGINVLINYIAPGSASVIINQQTYTLNLGTPTLISGTNYYVELTNISYLPILHTITLRFYQTLSAPLDLNLTSLNIPQSLGLTISKYSPSVAFFDRGRLLVSISTQSTSPQQVTINLTEMKGDVTLLPNNVLIFGFNLTAAPSSVTTNVTVRYSCSIPSNSIAPYILTDNTWKKIGAFTLNTTGAAGCDISMNVPADPTVAVFQSVTPKNSTNSTTTNSTNSTTGTTHPINTTTTTNSTTNGTTTAAQQTSTFILTATGLLIILVIIVAVGFYYLHKRREKTGKGTF